MTMSERVLTNIVADNPSKILFWTKTIIHTFHCFSVGNAGTGKSQVWKTLFRTMQNQKKKPMFTDLNPKVNNSI